MYTNGLQLHRTHAVKHTLATVWVGMWEWKGNFLQGTYVHIRTVHTCPYMFCSWWGPSRSKRSTIYFCHVNCSLHLVQSFATVARTSTTSSPYSCMQLAVYINGQGTHGYTLTRWSNKAPRHTNRRVVQSTGFTSVIIHWRRGLCSHMMVTW